MVFIEFFVEVLKESLGPWKQSRKRFAAFLLSTVEETHNGRHFQLSSKIMRGLFLIKICLIWINVPIQVIYWLNMIKSSGKFDAF